MMDCMPLIARALIFVLIATGSVAVLVPWLLVTRGSELPLGSLRWTPWRPGAPAGDA
jgi:hypothetical protein